MSTLCLSGWAQPADALSPLADDVITFDYTDYTALDDVFAALKNIPHNHVIAWSLGGAIALKAIAAGALAPKHLTLIAPPYQFVQTPDFIPAMEPFTYEKFRDNYATNPDRTKDRFLGLIAKGDRDFKRVLSELKHHPDVENTARWLPWLDWLGELHFSPDFAPITTPTLIVHGDQDAIVPVAQAQAIRQLALHHHVSVWHETGHAPHLHDAGRLRAEIAAHRGAST